MPYPPIIKLVQQNIKTEKKQLTQITQNTASCAENGRRSVQYAATSSSSSDRMYSYIPSPPLVVSSREECLAPPCVPLAVAPSCAFHWPGRPWERAIGRAWAGCPCEHGDRRAREKGCSVPREGGRHGRRRGGKQGGDALLYATRRERAGSAMQMSARLFLLLLGTTIRDTLIGALKSS